MKEENNQNQSSAIIAQNYGDTNKKDFETESKSVVNRRTANQTEAPNSQKNTSVLSQSLNSRINLEKPSVNTPQEQYRPKLMQFNNQANLEVKTNASQNYY